MVIWEEESYYGAIDWNGDDGLWGGCWGMVMNWYGLVMALMCGTCRLAVGRSGCVV